jgi:hypothetical protein
MYKMALAGLALCVTLLLGACGDSHTKVTTGTYAGESGVNAPYLDVGPLVYEVQLSRQLNPYDAEDATYLEGLSPAERKLEPGQEWFGVFVQVYNHTSQTQLASSDLTIADTQGNHYTPLVPRGSDPFIYRGGPVQAKSQIPEPNSVADDSPIQGALLLYKIKVISLDNRPIELKIADPADASQAASAELDV